MNAKALFSPLIAVAALLWLCGCGNRAVESALETDANAYQCNKCGTKFYTERSVFASTCPSCKDTDLRDLAGYLCEHDKAVTPAPRGYGSVRCQKCGKPTSGQVIPKEEHLKGWGISKKTAAEVGS